MTVWLLQNRKALLCLQRVLSALVTLQESFQKRFVLKVTSGPTNTETMFSMSAESNSVIKLLFLETQTSACLVERSQ